jgi:histidinol-phosphate phosphatase family protein
MTGRKRYVLLDRDGTVIKDKHYLSDPEGVEFEEGAVEGLRKLQELGFGLIVVTNQSGVGRGYFSLAQAEAVNERMRRMLAAEGITLAGIYTCPHAPEENCACRKPRPGLVHQAAREHRFDPQRALVVGDKPADVALATACGARGVLVLTGKGREAKVDAGTEIVPDLAALAERLAAEAAR